VSFFEQMPSLDSHNFEFLIPTGTENVDSDLSFILKSICSEKPSLLPIIKTNSVKFEKESKYFTGKFVEISENVVLEHGAIINAKIVKRQSQNEDSTTTKAHGELTK
jgi:hypothetical protein